MKAQIRQQILHTLQQQSEEVYLAQSQVIVTNALQQPMIQQALCVAVTVSRRPEVNTWPFIEALWAQGKKVVVPKCTPKTRQMTFYHLTQFTELETKYAGLLEPKPSETTVIDDAAIDIIVVPGVGFNKEGYRIGFGGGYYDRYLATHHKPTIALAFEAQIKDHIPHASHDIPVDQIVMAQRVIQCKEEREYNEIND